MRYLRVEWLHSDQDDPVVLYSEVDDGGREIRKVEIFPDGHTGFADEAQSAGGTELGEKPLPPLEKIAADPEFRPAWITKDEFENVWANRSRSTGKTKSA
jgi:hypothetical protein